MKNTKKLIIGMFFLIFGLLILQSCERVESVTGTPNGNEPTIIECNQVLISSGTGQDLEITEYKLAGLEYSAAENLESCYLFAFVSIDSIAITDSEIFAIETIELNLIDSMVNINGGLKLIDVKSKIISYLKGGVLC
jgi:hypothetical protein